MSMVSCTTCGRDVPAAFRFCGYCGQRLADHATGATSDLSQSTDVTREGFAVSPDDAFSLAMRRRDELRMVAVLFADVSGFTAMSASLGAEQVHEVMNEIFAGLGQAITAEAGVIDKYIGDNVMALFGAPVAHEDDPIRACRAALNMQAFLKQFVVRAAAHVGVELKMRIGVNYGPVVAGGVGSDVKYQYTVMGDTVNVASRLETSAQPGMVLVSSSVKSRAMRHFEFGPEQLLNVKGKAEPIPAFCCLRELDAAESDAAIAPSGAALMGRDQPLMQVLDWLDSSATSRRWLDVRGEMGMGKSRLIMEALALRPQQRAILVRPGGATARRSFGLIRRIIQESLALHTGNRKCLAEAAAFDDALIGLSPELEPYRQALWYVASPSLASSEPPDPNPQSLRYTVEQGVATFLRAISRACPDHLIFIDGYELSDPASVQLLHELLKQNEAEMPPIVTTSRDEAKRPPTPPAITLQLEPLSDDAAQALLELLLDCRVVPTVLIRDMLRRAAGIPLFIEEMVLSLRESGAIRRAAEEGVWPLEAGRASAALPVNLQAAMVSRLDRLDEDARELLCQCAVQGCDFDVKLVEAVREGDTPSDAKMRQMLDRLRDQRVLYPRDEQALRYWSFVRPLMQEACYETLLLRDRRELHAMTADAMCQLADGRHQVSPSLLADHEERAGRWLFAAEAHLRAGHDEAGLYLNEDALRRYGRVLELIEHAEVDEQATRHIAARAHGAAAEVYLLTGAYDRARDQADRMIALNSTPGDQAEGNRLLAEVDLNTGRTDAAMARLQLVVNSYASDQCPDADAVSRAWHGLAELHRRANRMTEALDCVTRCRQTACNDASLNQIRADLLEGSIRHTLGEFDQAGALYRRAFDAADGVGSLSQQARAINAMGNIERDRGDYKQARQHYERAHELWRQMGDVDCIAGAANNLGNVAMSVGDFAAAAEYYAQSSRSWQTIGNVRGAAMGQANLAILALEQGDGPAAIAAANRAIDQLEGTGDKVLWGLAMVVLGEGRLGCDELHIAQEVFEQVIERVTETDHRLAWAGAQRGLGHLQLRRGNLPDAEARLVIAAKSYGQLNRVQEQGRTILLLARVNKQAGGVDESLRLLEQARVMFASIGAQRDVEQAQSLLDNWSRQPLA